MQKIPWKTNNFIDIKGINEAFSWELNSEIFKGMSLYNNQGFDLIVLSILTVQEPLLGLNGPSNNKIGNFTQTDARNFEEMDGLIETLEYMLIPWKLRYANGDLNGSFLNIAILKINHIFLHKANQSIFWLRNLTLNASSIQICFWGHKPRHFYINIIWNCHLSSTYLLPASIQQVWFICL